MQDIQNNKKITIFSILFSAFFGFVVLFCGCVFIIFCDSAYIL